MNFSIKHFTRPAICALALICSGCTAQSVGIIGGSDGPTAVVVADKAHKTAYEKEAIRLLRIDGALYYETDEESEVEGRCGVTDGSFIKTAGRYAVPMHDGESNFDEASTYQIGMHQNTLEILIDDDCKIFQKIDTNTNILQYQYGYVLEGRLPNAEADSELLVLANEENITFDDASYIMFGSVPSAMKDIYVLPLID